MLLTKLMTSIAVLVMYAMSLPCENSRRKDEVPMTTSTPSTPTPVICALSGRQRLARLDGDASIIHVAADVRDDLCLQTELADCLAVAAALLGRCGRRQLDAVDTKVVKRLGNTDLGLGVEERVGELLALCACQYSRVSPRHSPRSVDSMILKFDTLLSTSL